MMNKEKSPRKLTRQNRSPLPLILHQVAANSSALRERRLEHERVDVVILLEIRQPRLQLVLDEVWHHVRHLDVSQLRIQLIGVNLRKFHQQPK